MENVQINNVKKWMKIKMFYDEGLTDLLICSDEEKKLRD